MVCKNCGQQIPSDRSFCPNCGAPLHHGMNSMEDEKKKRKKRTAVIICLIVLIVIVLGIVFFFQLRQLNEKSQSTAIAATETTVAATAVPTEKPKETATETKPAATENEFSITKDELEKEIESIRSSYYSPTAEDSKIELGSGQNGWNYSRDYRFHNGKLIFAFIFDGTEEHRLYFKDDHMIRYIDENGDTYDYPDTKQFSEWEQKALTEAYSAPEEKKNDSAPAEEKKNKTDTEKENGWVGIWTSSDGERLEIKRESEVGIELVFHKLSEAGNWMDVDYAMEFDSSDKKTVSEVGGPSDHGGWEYTFILGDGVITVKSRYPDKQFYKSES